MIDNAAKYAKNNTYIEIRIQNKDNQLIVKIEMISLKILETEKDKIFLEGFSGEIPRKIKKSGNGIGMSLVKQIIELNGGSISVEMDPKKFESVMGIDYQRNIFTFILPATKRSEIVIDS